MTRLPVLLGVAGFVLSAGLVAMLAFLAHDSKQRRLAVRLAERVAPLAPARAPSRNASPDREGADWSSLQRRLTRVCGVDLQRTDAYPWRWPLLVVICVLPAFGVARLLGNALGYPLDWLTPVTWVIACRVVFGTLHARHADKLYRQFPDVLAMIVRSVRAGIPLPEALRMVARESLQPTAHQFSRVADQLTIGIRLEDALREASARTGVAEYSFFTVALALQSQTGGSLAETLDNLGEVIRKRVALRARAIALASEARTSSYVLGALPVVTGAVLCVLQYDYIRPLFETKSGMRILYAATGMLLTGAFVMRSMIKRSLK